MRILLLGALGLAGGVLRRVPRSRHVVAAASGRARAPGTAPAGRRHHEGMTGLACRDSGDVVRSAGIDDLGEAEARPALAWAANKGSVEVLVELLRRTRTRIVLLSRDNVPDRSLPGLRTQGAR